MRRAGGGGTVVPRRRRGTTVLEMMVALVIGLFLAGTATAMLAGTRTAVVSLTARSERLAAVRVARVLLGAEGGTVPQSGIRGPAEDTLGTRSYRGTGIFCGGAGPGPLRVAAQGVRGPDAAKDSVLLLDRGGGWTVHDLVEVAPSGDSGHCPVASAGARLQRWVLDPPVPGRPLLGRYFERGSYHLAAGALRYRRGRSGRQPLTPGIVATPDSRFAPGPAGLRLLLGFGSGDLWVLPVGPEVGRPHG